MPFNPIQGMPMPGIIGGMQGGPDVIFRHSPMVIIRKKNLKKDSGSPVINPINLLSGNIS